MSKDLFQEKSYAPTCWLNLIKKKLFCVLYVIRYEFHAPLFSNSIKNKIKLKRTSNPDVYHVARRSIGVKPLSENSLLNLGR